MVNFKSLTKSRGDLSMVDEGVLVSGSERLGLLLLLAELELIVVVVVVAVVGVVSAVTEIHKQHKLAGFTQF